jgi:hypothetical protein
MSSSAMRVDALVKTKLKTPYPTLQHIIDLYLADAPVRRATAKSNSAALARIAKSVLKKTGCGTGGRADVWAGEKLPGGETGGSQK